MTSFVKSFVALATMVLSASALADNYKTVPTSLPNWRIVAQHTDKGDLLGCNASGAKDGLSVRVEFPAGASPNGSMSIEFLKSQDFNATVQSDSRTCATGGKDDAPAGTLRFKPGTSTEEICDGKHKWHAIEVGSFKTAKILADDKEIAEAKESANYKVDLSGWSTVVLQYTTWFSNVPQLKSKLAAAKKLNLKFDDGKVKAIDLSELQLDKVAVELKQCLDAK